MWNRKCWLQIIVISFLCSWWRRFCFSFFSKPPHVLIQSESFFFVSIKIYCCLLPHFIAFAFVCCVRVCCLFSIDLVVTHLLIKFEWLFGLQNVVGAQVWARTQTRLIDPKRTSKTIIVIFKYKHTHTYLVVDLSLLYLYCPSFA